MAANGLINSPIVGIIKASPLLWLTCCSGVLSLKSMLVVDMLDKVVAAFRGSGAVTKSGYIEDGKLAKMKAFA